MTGWLDEGQFNDQLCARTQRLRIERDWTQQQMATAIGVPFERYKKYESRLRGCDDSRRGQFALFALKIKGTFCP